MTLAEIKPMHSDGLYDCDGNLVGVWNGERGMFADCYVVRERVCHAVEKGCPDEHHVCYGCSADDQHGGRTAAGVSGERLRHASETRRELGRACCIGPAIEQHQLIVVHPSAGRPPRRSKTRGLHRVERMLKQSW